MKQCLIIAEAGVNHNGRLELALALVDAAADAGADIVKFQTFRTEDLVSTTAEKAEYQKRNSGSEESQHDMLRKLELGLKDHITLKKHCVERGIEFLSTPFDLASVDLLAHIGLRRWKIPSGEITNLPLLRAVARQGGEVLLSTGMANLGEVEDAISALEAAGLPRVNMTVLHCTTDYPAPMSDVNLRAMTTMRSAFGIKVGYSDHTEGIIVPVAAAALGAEVIEKHLTLDRSFPGPDHKASLEPLEFGAMVKAIRGVGECMGDGIKRITPSERMNRIVARKSIIAIKPILAGMRIDESMLGVRRPAGGMSPMSWDMVIGSIAHRDYASGEVLEP